MAFTPQNKRLCGMAEICRADSIDTALSHSSKSKTPDQLMVGRLLNNSLTMSYFHTGTRTIIGAEAFHCPVRDGKEWVRLAMVIRLNLLLYCLNQQIVNS